MMPQIQSVGHRRIARPIGASGTRASIELSDFDSIEEARWLLDFVLMDLSQAILNAPSEGERTIRLGTFHDGSFHDLLGDQFRHHLISILRTGEHHLRKYPDNGESDKGQNANGESDLRQGQARVSIVPKHAISLTQIHPSLLFLGGEI